MNRYGDRTNSVQNLHPVKVLKGMMREGSEETRQWQGDPEGERELLRTGAQQLSRTRRNSLVPIVFRAVGIDLPRPGIGPLRAVESVAGPRFSEVTEK